jgi:glycosyltransferase involved in cell wall biosynthesis
LPQNLGYVIGSFKEPGVIQHMKMGRRPLSEYAVFLNRNRARAFFYDDVAQLGADTFEILKEENMLAWGMPSVILSAASSLDAIIVSGEDVGLPLALALQKQKVRMPVYIITHGFVVRTVDLMMSVRDNENIHFLCLSKRLKEMLVERFQVPGSRVINTGYGVDTQFFRPAKTPSSRPVIVSAGTTNRDYRTLVRAVGSLDAEVKIAADSAWHPMEVDISQDRLPENFEVRSYGTYERLRQLYEEAAFVVVPLRQSLSACGYAVIAEAMAMGKVVIATKTESYSDFILDGETGYYVAPGDVADLREKIEHLLTNPALANQMGRRARIRMERQFSQEKYCERLEGAIMGLPAQYSACSATFSRDDLTL